MKGIILAAGYGTRFLPITKTIPKEMLPLGTRPAIDYVVEEYVRSGDLADGRPIFGDPSRIEFKAITTAERVPAVQKGSVDVVADAMTVTCARRQQVAVRQYPRAATPVGPRQGSRGRPPVRRPDGLRRLALAGLLVQVREGRGRHRVAAAPFPCRAEEPDRRRVHALRLLGGSFLERDGGRCRARALPVP